MYDQASGFSPGLLTGSVDETGAILFSIILIAVLYYGMKRHPERSARLVVAIVAIAGTTSGLILFRISLESWGAPPALFILTLPLGYLGVNWSIRGYFGSLSARKTTGLMVASATLLGVLLGTSLSTMLAIVFLVTLTIFDAVAIELNALPSLVGKENYDQVVSISTLQLENYAVGLGDFLTYAILSSVALRVLGIIGALATSALIVLGIAITFKLTTVRGKVPGLLFPVGFGMMPIVLGLLLA